MKQNATISTKLYLQTKFHQNLSICLGCSSHMKYRQTINIPEITFMDPGGGGDKMDIFKKNNIDNFAPLQNYIPKVTGWPSLIVVSCTHNYVSSYNAITSSLQFAIDTATAHRHCTPTHHWPQES